MKAPKHRHRHRRNTTQKKDKEKETNIKKKKKNNLSAHDVNMYVETLLFANGHVMPELFTELVAGYFMLYSAVSRHTALCIS